MGSPLSGSKSSTVPVRTSTYWYDWREVRPRRSLTSTTKTAGCTVLIVPMRSMTRVRPMLALTRTRCPTIEVIFSWISST